MYFVDSVFPAPLSPNRQQNKNPSSILQFIISYQADRENKQQRYTKKNSEEYEIRGSS